MKWVFGNGRKGLDNGGSPGSVAGRSISWEKEMIGSAKISFQSDFISCASVCTVFRWKIQSPKFTKYLCYLPQGSLACLNIYVECAGRYAMMNSVKSFWNSRTRIRVIKCDRLTRREHKHKFHMTWNVASSMTPQNDLWCILFMSKGTRAKK